jgi:hypothetical protein
MAWRPGPHRRRGQLSATTAWAVGTSLGIPGASSLTLIEHWNGRRWHTQPSISPGGQSFLLGVTALTRSRAWAAGLYTFGGNTGTLVEAWDGTSWTEPSTPAPACTSGRWEVRGP